MKKLLFALLTSCLMLALLGAGCSPIDARPKEQLLGTYSLVEYSYYDTVITDVYSDRFEYFYMVFDESLYARIVYKLKSEQSYVGFVTAYTFKYKRASTELIQELMLNFVMPLSCIKESAVYMLTVSPQDMLSCRRSKYTAPQNSGERVRREMVYFTLRRVSADQTLGYVESRVGPLPDIYDPYA